ncbi:HtaA domain-containing protein [Leucobacter massiliensis]|uniref:Htaa domain-containing protein n=1 Tax=Leucobacter massiliensis TaxID=1686285 RepID=A0A2S9QL02_9MICO|nr:HtaA domain-containing protein [Leucobacter massiliensis]PRI10268.1 hypothetical protein B4915_12800 [Leucobacter massiliensis]
MRTPTSQHHRPRPRLPRLAAALALAASLLVAPAVSAPAALADEGTGVSITEGSVIWGFKESWRDYMGADGTELAGGVEWTEDGLFAFPVERGSFEPETGTLILELAGSLHFTGYCGDGFCQLDSRFEELRVEIGPEQQLVRGTYSGRPQDDPTGPITRQEDAVFGVLDIFDVTPETRDGVTSWDRIPAASGGILYGAGTPIDPVSIRYTGPGGKPDLAERWSPQGVPAFTPGAEWTSQPTASSAAAPAVRLSESEPILFVTEFLGTDVAGRARTVFRALDPVTLEERAATEFAAGSTQYLRTAFDPIANTTFFMVGDTVDEQRTVTLHAARWTGDGFSVEAVDSVAGGAGITSWPLAGGVLAWTGSELLWSTLLRDPGVDFTTGHVLHGYRPTDSGWEHTPYAVELPPETLQGSAARARTFFGNGSATDRNDRGLVVQGDGSLVLAPGGSYQDLAGATAPRPLVRLARSEDATRWTARHLPGTVAEKPGVAAQAFTGIARGADGGLLAHSAPGVDVIQYLVLEGDTVASSETVSPSDTRAGSGTAVAADPALGFDYALSPATGTAQVLSGHRTVSELEVPNALTRTAVFVVLPDHALLTSAHAADDGTITLRRYDFAGLSPTISAHPQPASVVLTQGALSAPADLSVVVTPEADAEVQWQRKLPGQSRFQNVEGATGTEYRPELGLELDGAEYRAVAANAAGRVVSEAAAVSVASAPRFEAQPVSLTVYAGDRATFSAPMTEDVTGEQRWERLVDGAWTAIEADAELEPAGHKLRVHASQELDGAIFRSVLSNEVGENVSEEVTLTVRPRSEIPPEGLRFTGVGFEWEFSEEMQARPPYGGANHFSAGVSDGSEASYRAASGTVRIQHVAADGSRTDASYASRSAFVAAASRQLVTLGGGEARLMPDGSATVRWNGSFSVNMYGGLVPFTLTDPVLTVDPAGDGRLSAELAGYAGDMSNPAAKTPLDPVKDATVAEFSGVRVDVLNGFTVEPHYAGVEARIPDGHAPQLRDVEGWGSWPQPFVDFQLATGLSSYWYTSGSTFDAKKAPSAILVDFSSAEQVVEGPGSPGGADPAGDTTGDGTAAGSDGGSAAADAAAGGGSGAAAGGGSDPRADGLAATGSEPGGLLAAGAAGMLLLAGGAVLLARRGMAGRSGDGREPAEG